MRTRKTVVVLVSGKAGSGKSTVADMLQAKLQDVPALTIFRYSFASPLKYMAEKFMGWNGEKDEKGRKLLQEQGRIGREYDPDTWVKHLLIQMDRKAGMFPFNFVIVDDWRFPNELSYLQQNPILDVCTVRVAGRQADLPGNTSSDASENSLPDIPDNVYNHYISNKGDLQDLEMRVDEVVKILTERFILE
jgi:hypothetical protein